MKVGETRWSCWADMDVGRLVFWEWRCRTIRGGFAYFIQKDAITWGKRSTRNGDFGWLDKNIVPSDRKKFPTEQCGGIVSMVACSLGVSKRGAIDLEVRRLRMRKKADWAGPNTRRLFSREIAFLLKKRDRYYRRKRPKAVAS